MLPSNLSVINDALFGFCKNLNNVEIPVSVTQVKSSAFASCSSLDTLYYKGSSEAFGNITVESNNGKFQKATVVYSIGKTDSDKVYWKVSDDGALTIFGSGNMKNFDRLNAPPLGKGHNKR